MIEGNEGSRSAVFHLSLSRPSETDISFDYQTVDGTATAGLDYLATAGTITFLAGQLEALVEVPVLGDYVKESDEQFTLAISTNSFAIASVEDGLATIIDDDPQNGPMASDDAYSARIGETLVVDAASGVLANDSDVEGDAISAELLTTTGNGTLQLRADGSFEYIPAAGFTGTDSFTYRAFDGIGYSMPATVTITTARMPMIEVADVVVDEGAGFAEFVVRLSAPSSEVVTVQYDDGQGTANSNDYNTFNIQTLSFDPGQTVQTVRVAIVDDTDVEPDELFYLNLSNPTNALIGRTQITATIIDNDGAAGAPELSISDPVIDESAGEAIFVLRLDRPGTTTVTADYTTANGTATEADYTPVSGSVSFVPGEMVQIVRVPVTDDTLAEPIERFDLVLSNVSGATLPDDRGTATIGESDQPVAALPMIEVADVVVDEGAGFAEFVVRLSAPSSEVVTVQYDDGQGTANSNDYNTFNIQTLSFDPGQTVQTVRVAIVDDTDVEPDETFQLVLSNATNATIATPSVTTTILDNDGPQADGVEIAPIADVIVAEGGNRSVTVAFTDGNDDGTAGWTFQVDWDDDGSIDQQGSIAAGATSFVISRTFPDGPASQTARVRVIDEAGTDEATASFTVTIDNVPPSLSLAGADIAAEGDVYTLSGLDTLLDPGQDTPTAYVIDWGDGSSESFTPAEFQALGGSTGHVFADGPASTEITVSVTDEDGTFVAGRKTVTVDNLAPVVALDAVAALNEGDTYLLTITGSDAGGAGDPLSYLIDWGDGSAPQSVTQAELDAAGGALGHVFADDEDGPVNATLRTVSVTVSDDDGGSSTATRSVTVRNVAPSLDLLGADSTDEGGTYTLALANLVDPGQDSITGISIDWGDGSAPEQVVGVGNAVHVFADDGRFTVAVTLTDEDGSYVFTRDVSVSNLAPIVSVTGNADIDEGNTFNLAISGSDPAGAADPLSFTIDWGDGSPIETVSQAVIDALGSLGHVYADDEDGPVNATPRTITVIADDGDGGTTSASHVVNVHNVAPEIDLLGPAGIELAQDYTLTLGRIVDPGTDTVTILRVDWGDGNVEEFTAAGDVTHQYAAEGRFAVSVALIDEDGTHLDAGTTAVEVTPPTPVLSVDAGADASIAEGELFTRTIAFADGEDNGEAGWTFQIDYGDGTVDTGTTLVRSLDLAHTYADGDASRQVRITLSDGPDETASDSFNVAVTNLAPALSIATDAGRVDEGGTILLTVTGSDPAGAADPLTYTIDWGDGSAIETMTQAELDAVGSVVAHVFGDDEDGPVDLSDRQVTVTVSDGDGGSATATATVTVANVAPTIPLSGANSVAEGDSYALGLGDLVDPGADSVSAFVIDWGDGSRDTFDAAGFAALAGTASHVFADGDASREIRVTVTDEDGSFVAGTRTVEVTNVAPSVAVVGADSIDEGGTYALTITTADAAGAADPVGVTIDWGDGATLQSLGAAELAAAGGVVSHVFADDEDGPVNATGRTIVVTADDGDGGSATQTRHVAVINVAPVIALAGAASVEAGSAYALTLGEITDPGSDTVTNIVIDWGDGDTTETGAAGTVSHTFGEAGARSIVVSLVDEDGTHSPAGTLDIQVEPFDPGNQPPQVIDDSYAVHAGTALDVATADGLLANDRDPDGDPLQVLAVDGPANGTLDFDADGAFRYTPAPGFTGTETLHYTVSDGIDTAQGTLQIQVDNQAPATAPDSYTLVQGRTILVDAGAGLLANDSDPDGDLLQLENYQAAANGSLVVNPDGSFSYTPNAGFSGTESLQYAVSDGTVASIGSFEITVEAVQLETIRIGDAPTRLSRANPDGWQQAWRHDAVIIEHKAELDNGQEAWSDVNLLNVSPTTLAGGDSLLGDLGVSGRTLPTTLAPQELDGTEALRFLLDGEATGGRVAVSRFFLSDDGNVFAEAGRLQMFDAQGKLVGEQRFTADGSATQVVSFESDVAFSEVVFAAGAYDGDGFVFGAYAQADGSFGSPAFADDGAMHGSDYMLDWIEFDFLAPVQGVGIANDV